MKRAWFWSALVALVVIVCGAAVLVTGWNIGRKAIPRIEFHGQIMRPDPVLGFSRIPNASGRRRDLWAGDEYDIYTNGWSARVNRPHEPTPDHVDVLTIGCSFSEGHGLQNEQTFTSIIGERLHVPVANFAIGSYGSVTSLLMLERWEKLHPKVVVYGLLDVHRVRNISPCANSLTPDCIAQPYIAFDAHREPYIVPVRPEELIGMELNIAAVSTVGTFSPLKTALYGLKLALHRNTPRFTAPQYFPYDEEHDGDRSLQYAVARMKAVTDRIHAKLLIAYFPLMSVDDARPFKKTALLPEGVTFVDTTAPLVAAMQSSEEHRLYVTPVDGHPSAKAHAVMADTILREIDSRHLLRGE